MDKLAILVLGAGLGKRLGLELPKVLVETSEMPLIVHLLSAAAKLNPDKVVVITGHKKELVEARIKASLDNGQLHFKNLSFAVQPQQLGTGHAVQCALPELGDFVGTVLILYGDVPLTRPETFRALLDRHIQERATITVLTATTASPASYGRIIRDQKGLIKEIREKKDCSPQELLIEEINSGIYAVDSAFLKPAVQELKNENAQKEYYLTDIVARAVKEGQAVSSLTLSNVDEVMGVNDLSDLTQVNDTLRKQRVQKLITAGVLVEDPATFYPDSQVRVEKSVKIGPNVILRGSTSLAAGVVLEGNAYLVNCVVETDAFIKYGVRAEDAVIGPRVAVGPFAHLRPGTKLHADVRIGNFVETKNAELHRGAKANHLTYLGDSTIGEESNIGAGTITCNYDGYKKSKTTIGKAVFIGSNTALVAPVTVKDGSVVGAGSVITSDVEADSLAVTRAPQTAKPGWAARRRELMERKK